jgi:hypothetical protein
VERAFRAFICATGDLCRPLRAELVPRQTAANYKLLTIQDVIAAEELIPKSSNKAKGPSIFRRSLVRWAQGAARELESSGVKASASDLEGA